jgi:pimeloyl-ACP methyl ester carboxylesterase
MSTFDQTVLTLPFRGTWRAEMSPERRVPSHGTHLFATTHGIDFVAVQGRRSATIRDWRTVLSTEQPERLHRVVAESGVIGDDAFRSYFVIQTPVMLERCERHVAAAAALVDQAALERIGEHWDLALDDAPPYEGPTGVVAGRLDSTVGYAAAIDLVDHYPHASLAVVDDTGHALPHERPELLRALLDEWLARVERSI